MYIALIALAALWITALSVVLFAGGQPADIDRALSSDEQLVVAGADWEGFDQARAIWAVEDVNATNAA